MGRGDSSCGGVLVTVFKEFKLLAVFVRFLEGPTPSRTNDKVKEWMGHPVLGLCNNRTPVDHLPLYKGGFTNTNAPHGCSITPRRVYWPGVRIPEYTRNSYTLHAGVPASTTTQC